MLVLVAAACGTEPTTLHVERAIPEYAPLIGGTTIRINGTGFLADEAGPSRVLIASREAPLARTIDDTALEVVLPPGDRPGDVEVVVLNRHGNARATGILRYSAAPTIDSVEPVDVLFTSEATVVSLTGSGFLDEGAGQVDVVVDGALASDVVVTSDTTLTFVAPQGLALVRPDLEVINRRGTATKQRGFRYTPSTRKGLLMISVSGPQFATFYDPTDHSTVAIPRAASPARFTAIVRDERGDYWGVDRSRRFGPINWRTQRLASMSALQAWIPALSRVGTEYFGLNRSTLQFGTLEAATGAFTPIGASMIPCCGTYGLAFDGATLYFTGESVTGAPAIAPIDPATGIAGTPVPTTGPPGFRVEDMRFFEGTLYVASRDGTLVTLDPLTGMTTRLPVSLGRFTAMEVFE